MDKGDRQLVGQGQNAFEFKVLDLALLYGTYRSQCSNDPVKDGSASTIWGQGVNVCQHPKSHLTGDHVLSTGNRLIILEGRDDN